MKNIKSVSVIGLGYIGLPTSAMFASHNLSVIGVDTNPVVIETINQGKIHIEEPFLEEMVKQVVEAGLYRATDTPEPADAFCIAVPTPFKGENHAPDLDFIHSACLAIAPVLKSGDIVILESTSPVGTTEQMADWLAGYRADLTFPQDAGENSDIRIAYCPERVLPGYVIKELVINDRVIGGMTAACAERAVELYKVFVTGNCVVASNPRVAEMAKLTENSFRDVNIAFANELSMICQDIEIDVWELIALANRHPRVEILQPGAGVGGHCIAVDPWFIIHKSPDLALIIRAAREVNDKKPDWVVSEIERRVGIFLAQNPERNLLSLKICCYGLTFKPDIDDIRESPALEIVKKLSSRLAAKIVCVEPHLNPDFKMDIDVEMLDMATARDSADFHCILVNHRVFADLLTDPSSTFDLRPK